MDEMYISNYIASVDRNPLKPTDFACKLGKRGVTFLGGLSLDFNYVSVP